VRIAYAAAPARDSEHPPAPGALQPRVSGGGSSSSSSSTHPTPAAQQVAVVGRQMSLPLAFRIHPTLLVTALGFSEYYSPLRDGVRCTTPHLIPAPMPQVSCAGTFAQRSTCEYQVMHVRLWHNLPIPSSMSNWHGVCIHMLLLCRPTPTHSTAWL
jgi:hypothetical protein